MHPGNNRPATALRFAASHWSFFLVLLVYLVLRLPVLEMDPPPFSRLAYQTLDEMYYALVAYEWHRLPLGEYENLPFNLLQNVIVFLATALGGWSYGSVRMGALVSGALGMLFVYVAFVRSCPPELDDRPLARNLLFAAAGLALVTSVAFHYATVILEPSISVALYTATVLLVLSAPQPNPWLVGAAIASGPVLFYPYTLAYMAGAATAVLVWLGPRPVALLKAAGGATLLVAAVLCAFLAVYPMDWREAVAVVGSFGKSRVLDLSTYPWSYLLQKYLELFPRTNLFRYSPLLLPVAIGALLVLAGHAARVRRLPAPAVLAALGMLGARLVLLFIEKTHYERKASDMAFLLLFLVLVASGLLYGGIRRFLQARTGRADAAILAAAIGMLPLVAVAGTNLGNLRGELRSASFHNRDALVRLGERLRHCTAVGEWGIGLGAQDQFDATLNIYRYAATLPPSTDAYNAEILRRLRRPGAVVISTVPPSPFLSAEVQQALVPVHRFQFRTGRPAPTEFAVYVPRDAIASRAQSACQAARLAPP